MRKSVQLVGYFHIYVSQCTVQRRSKKGISYWTLSVVLQARCIWHNESENISHCKASTQWTTFSISNVAPTSNSPLNITAELHRTPMLLSNKSELIPAVMSGYIRLHSRTIDSLLTSRPHFRHLWTWICFIPKRRVISVSSSCSSLEELVFPFSGLSPSHM